MGSKGRKESGFDGILNDPCKNFDQMVKCPQMVVKAVNKT
jgi:hypothetical protein